MLSTCTRNLVVSRHGCVGVRDSLLRKEVEAVGARHGIQVTTHYERAAFRELGSSIQENLRLCELNVLHGRVPEEVGISHT